MKTKYYLLTTNPFKGEEFAFEEDGTKYYVIWYDNIIYARHGLCILGKDCVSHNIPD